MMTGDAAETEVRRHRMIDPMSDMQQAVITLHEIYSSLRQGGFNQSEALELMVKMQASVQTCPNCGHQFPPNIGT